jgi:hypothetical protein
MEYGRLQRFVSRHGNVAIFDSHGGIHRLHDGSDSQVMVENADRFLWDGLERSSAEMETLLAQTERGLSPGCVDCDRLETELIAARDRDRQGKNLDMRHELPALTKFQEHRRTH